VSRVSSSVIFSASPADTDDCVGFFLTGTYLDANLPLSIGFINIPAFIIFIPITMFMARVGANTSNNMDKSKLQRFFGIFLYAIGTLFLYRYLNI